MRRWLSILFTFFIIPLFMITFYSYAYAQNYKNSLGMTMVYIKGGEFMMGDQNNQGGSDEKPVSKVTLGPFFLAETVVTSAQWEEFYYDSDTEWDDWEEVKKYSPEGIYPIILISWKDAVDFCEWLSEKEGKKYRLPTEAEWEYAGRGGLQKKLYPWGDDAPNGDQCNFADKKEYLKEKDIWAEGITINDGHSYCAQVKQYPPNNFGLYQMVGNVLEWCSDWYSGIYYKEAVSKNPKGPSTGKQKVLRGGAWCFPSVMLRVSDRFGLSPAIQKEFISFRVAMDINKE